MKKVIIILLILVQAPLWAQEYTQTFRGTIKDADTYETLPGANVIILNSDPFLGTTTDMDGNFRIDNIPVGRHNIKISYVGYKDILLNQIELITGNELVLEIKMLEDVETLNEVVVKAKERFGEPINSMVTTSAQKISIESTSRVAASINDPARTVQSFAGVSSEDDENNELVVRGNSPRGMLWRMEGVEIPNPNHFSNGEGGSGGGVSALSSRVLDNSDFYTGAFAAEYGNALSSVFDLRLRKGNNEKHEFALQLGVMGIQASAEGPFSKKSNASYLFNYRYATTSLLNNAGFTIGDTDIYPEWQDLSFNINLPTKKLGTFNIWGLAGISSSEELVPEDTAQWLYRGDNFTYSENQKLAVAGLSNHYLLKNNKTYFKTVLSVSHTNNYNLEDTLDYEMNKTKTLDEEYIYQNATASFLVNHKFNSKNLLRSGIILTHHTYDLKMQQYNWDREILETKLNDKGATNRYQAYLQWKHNFSNEFNFKAGVHATYLAISNDYSIEPRLGLSYDVNKTNQINLAFGLHSKMEPLSIYMAQKTLEDGQIIRPNEDLKMTRAFHAVLGHRWNFAPSFKLSTEVYYQYLFDVPIQKDDTTGTMSALNFSSGFTNEAFVNKGTGTNYGLEISLEKSFSNQYYLMFNTSLFQSTYKMPGFEERSTRYNGNYILNTAFGKEFKVGKTKQNIIAANIRGIWRGGYKVIPVDLNASIESGETVWDYSRAYDDKVPDYLRVDVGVSYRKNNPKWSWIVSLDVQNLTNRSNVWGEYYNSEIKEIEPIYMTGLIPVLNFKVEF